MSGGALTDYGVNSLYSITNWAREIERENPLLAQQLRDLFDLLHAYDYYLSGDYGKVEIEKAWTKYREKWIKMDTDQVVQILFDKCLEMVDGAVKGCK